MPDMLVTWAVEVNSLCLKIRASVPQARFEKRNGSSIVGSLRSDSSGAYDKISVVRDFHTASMGRSQRAACCDAPFRWAPIVATSSLVSRMCFHERQVKAW